MKEFKPVNLSKPYNDTKEENLLIAAVEEYHKRTEAFDRVHCRARNERGIAIPSNGYELVVINQNAKSVRAEILLKYSLTNQQFQDALWHFNNHQR